MMNVLSLSVLLASLAAASIFSPPPNPNTDQNQKQAAATIVREGHRVVVVEYDQDGLHNTKISISPPSEANRDNLNVDSESLLLHNTKDRIKEAASVLPNVGQGISSTLQTDGNTNPAFLHAPKELICDTYGKCKHRIADAMGKAKDKAQESLEKQKDFINSNRDAVAGTIETVYDKANDVREYTKESVENAKEHIAQNVSEARDGLRKAAKRVLGWTVATEVVNLLGFATAYGMCMWVTFISSYVLSGAMPRQQFAVAQSKIYPVYFRAMGYSIGMALLGHVFSRRNSVLSNKGDMLQAYNLLASLLAVFLNSLYLEPRATKLMFERMRIEKEEGRGREDILSASDGGGSGTSRREEEQDAVRTKIIKLNEKLKRLNTQSSLLNILNLMSLTWHLVYLAQRLHRPLC